MLAAKLLALVGAPGLIIGLTATPASATDTYTGPYGVGAEIRPLAFCVGPGPGPGWTCEDQFTHEVFNNCFYSENPNEIPDCLPAPITGRAATES
jgi:hypothetical protein